MRLVFTRKVADLTANGFTINSQPIPENKRTSNQIAVQYDGDERMPEWDLEHHAAGMHMVNVHEKVSGREGTTLNLYFAAVQTDRGQIGTLAETEAEATEDLHGMLVLSKAGGSGAELAVGQPNITPAARAKIIAFAHPAAEQTL
jgi:hypothetical protein